MQFTEHTSIEERLAFWLEWLTRSQVSHTYNGAPYPDDYLQANTIGANMDRLTKAFKSGSEHMSMPQYLEAQRVYIRELRLDLAHLVAIGAPEYLRERVRLELASLGVRS